MFSKRVKCLSVAVFSIIYLLTSITVFAQHKEEETAGKEPVKHEEGHGDEKKKKFNASEVILATFLMPTSFIFLTLATTWLPFLYR